jgi:hypothetical protein
MSAGPCNKEDGLEFVRVFIGGGYGINRNKCRTRIDVKLVRREAEP